MHARTAHIRTYFDSNTKAKYYLSGNGKLAAKYCL